MSSHGVLKGNRPKFGSGKKASERTVSGCSGTFRFRAADKGSRFLRRDCDTLDIPLPRHRLGYCDAELRKFVTPRGLHDFARWIYGQTCGMERDHLIYYTEDVVRWIFLREHGVPTYFD